MATVDEINTELREMLASYPQHAAKLDKSQLSAMRDVWQKRLADLPPELLTMACTNHIERSQWLPSIAEIRASAVSLVRQASPADQDWNEAYADLQKQILQIGYTGIPEWRNPALAETVKTLGGWMAVCFNEDPEGVFRKQFKDVYEVVISRMERKVTQSPAVREFISSMQVPANGQLEAGNVTDLVKRLAEAKRA